MAIGDRVISEGVEYEVIWSGGPLLAPRDSRPDDLWESPPRVYNKTGNHTKPAHGCVVVDKPDTELHNEAPPQDVILGWAERQITTSIEGVHG